MLARKEKKMIRIGQRQETKMRRIMYFLLLAVSFGLVLSCQSRNDSQLGGREAPGGGTSSGGATEVEPVVFSPDQKIGGAQELQAGNAGPLIGGWRSVGTELDYRKNYFFGMLPSIPAQGERFAAYDLVANRVVCCAVVEGGELSETYLGEKLYIPGAWVNDLVNNWNLDAAPYRPRVVELKLIDALGSYDFPVDKRQVDGISMTRGGGLGGLLLPENSEVVGLAKLHIDGHVYTVDWSGHLLADDDGVVHTYVLKSDDGETFSVEVPYGTN